MTPTTAGVGAGSRRVRPRSTTVRLALGVEKAVRQEVRHHPVGIVHNLTDLEVGGHGAQSVRLQRREAARLGQMSDHTSGRIARRLEEVGADAGGGVVSLFL